MMLMVLAKSLGTTFCLWPPSSEAQITIDNTQKQHHMFYKGAKLNDTHSYVGKVYDTHAAICMYNFIIWMGIWDHACLQLLVYLNDNKIT